VKSPLPPRAASVAACGALLLIFAALAGSAVRTKSPTADEPNHVLSGWLWTRYGDFRSGYEDPPLWGYWMSIPNGRDALRVNFDDPGWADIARVYWWPTRWWWRTLYETPGNDAAALVARSRWMALVIGVMLGAATACYAGRLAGGGAAVVAAGLFAFDPNFLAHAPLVKNDVAITLVFLALSYACWRCGSRATVANAAAVGVLGGVAMGIKFSGLLALPIVAALLLVRATTREPWRVLRRGIDSRPRKLLAAVCLFAATCAIAIVVVWASYGFRYRAIPDGATALNIRLHRALAIKSELRLQDPSSQPTPEQLAATPPSGFVAAVVALNDRHLMPEAWCNGLLFTYHTSLIRPSYLLGEVRLTGWWYYFPLAMLVKTPMATILLATCAGLAAASHPGSRTRDFARTWAILCLLLPPAIYFLVAMRTNLNLGIRHVLPVYPPIFIATGWAAAIVWKRVARLRPGIVLLLLAVAFEAVSSWPDYLAFFNLASGGPRGGIALLGDSNLDWGQDLPALARWHADHPDRPIHLRYFGGVDSDDYIDAMKLDPARPPTDPRAVLAVSATYLQGLYVADEQRPFFDALRHRTPIDVLGGSIYLFDNPPATEPTSQP
jgi:hypothetical protein